MNLSTAQKATVKAWLDANASALSDDAAAAALNAKASPAYLAWKSVVTRIEVQTSSGFDWTRVDNLSVGKARIWDGLFNATDSMPCNLGNYRTGINAVWVGTQADLDVRAAVNAACQRTVTVFEKLFATLTTTGPAQSGARGASTNADTLGLDTSGAPIEGNISGQQVSDIRGGL